MMLSWRAWLTRERSPSWVLLTGLWLLILLLFPVGDWLSEGGAFPTLVGIVIVAQALAVTAMLRLDWSWRRLASGAVTVLLIAWAAEVLGSRFGLIFGAYDYGAALQPQLAGVPVLIPFAWAMMLPAAWAVAAGLISPRYRLAHAVLSGFVFTAWDLYLDPQWVARGLWTWETNGPYFGIPLENFAGWIATAAVITFVVRPTDLQRARSPLAILYTIVAITQAVALGLFWGQPGPALCGLLAMGGFSAAYWMRARRSSRARGLNEVLHRSHRLPRP
ncbi:MAG TPA: carotenoid biosynthesis protein [Anaerolineales bacterium]|nr:carotenoid biosynthesis protein [Anaerolineales bacterium]HRF50975.1 carotenoid biosynthesis protein [Anaerolineales bacterium]